MNRTRKYFLSGPKVKGLFVRKPGRKHGGPEGGAQVHAGPVGWLRGPKQHPKRWAHR